MESEPGPKLGPTGIRSANNLRALRGRISVRDLSARLKKVGRPILPSGITKIEQGSRRIDVDDLVALALVLDVTPNRLLLAAGAGAEHVELVPDMMVPAISAWAWACGDELIVHPYAGDDAEDDEEWERHIRPRYERFAQVNRPHDPKDLTPLQDLLPHRDVLDLLVDAVRQVEAAGVPRKAAYHYVTLQLADSEVSDG